MVCPSLDAPTAARQGLLRYLVDAGYRRSMGAAIGGNNLGSKNLDEGQAEKVENL